MTTHQRTVLQRILDWLRAGYPHGVPQHDYIALLGVLHRHLTETEVAEIAAELAEQSDAGAAITEDDIRRLIHDRAFEQADDDDVARVSARLAEGGWPLADAQATVRGA